MKKLKNIFTLLITAAVLAFMPGVNTLTASAEEPVTYYIKYLSDDNQWRFQTGSTWSDTVQHRELYYAYQEIKDGDSVIIEGANPGFVFEVSVRLGNVTFLHGSAAVVTAKSIDECYVLRDSVAAINGDVTNAYVYDNARCTFNNNIGTLQILNDPARNDTLLRGTVTAGGTVNHLIGKDNDKLHYELYNFAAGKLSITNGDVKTDAAYYSTSASAGTTQTANTAQPSATQSSSDEYDDVPKTGESSLVFWLLGVSAICFTGRYLLKKTA